MAVVAAAGVALITNGLPHKLGLIAAALSGILAGYLASQIWSSEEILGETNE